MVNSKTKNNTTWSNRVYISNNEESFLKEREENKPKEKELTEKASFPKNALIELTSACNHACVFCANPRMKRKAEQLDLDIFKDFLREAVELGLEEVGFYTTGEPLVKKNLKEFVKMAADSGIKYIYITTNGALASIEKMKELIDLGLSSVKFSINAASRETYRLIHGKDDYDKVIKNLRDLKSYRDNFATHVKLMASFVVTKQAESEIDLWMEEVVPYVDDAKILGGHGQMGQALDQLRLLESSLTTTYPEIGQAKPCHMLWDRIHLTQEGLLTLCCVDYENNLAYADLSKVSLKEAWSGDIIVSMRKKHLERKLKGTLCHNCLYGVNEPYEPINKIYDSSKQKNNKKGELSVVKRIEELSLLKIK